MKTSEEIQALLAQAIEQLDLPQTPVGLYDPVRYILSMGGKRVRPRLTLMACELFADDVTPALPAALGLEIFHNFTLLHDDIMDRADMRRGHLTVHRKWDESTAILSGDVMQMIACRYMCQVRPGEVSRVLDAFSRMAIEVCEGQQHDKDFELRNNVSEEEYIEMIRLKTAVLLGTALRIGAWIGGATDADADHLYRFGIDIGLAFQLKDDLLDTYGDEHKFGKRIGGDITCNKKTFLLIQTCKLATGHDAAELSRLLSTNEPSAEKIAAMIALYDRLGVRRICEEKMEQFYLQAIAHLEKVSVNSDKKHELRKLAAKLMARNE